MVFYFKVFVLSILLIDAVYTDIKKDIITNRLILTGYGTAFIFSVIQNGGKGLFDSIMAAFVMIFALLIFFLIKGLGAGDIKLLSVIAAYFPLEGVHIAILSFLIGGIYIILRMPVRAFCHKKIFVLGETMHFSIPIVVAVGIWTTLFVMK